MLGGGEDVEHQPEQGEQRLEHHEGPAADQPRQVAGQALLEAQAAVRLAVEVADRPVVVAVTSEASRQVFDLADYEHVSA